MSISKSLVGSILLCAIIFQGWIAQNHFQLRAEDYGLFPRNLTSLGSILSMPLFHASPEHLWGNLLSLFCLSFLLGLFAPGLLARAILIIWLAGGALLWLIGRPLWHIGASGLVYGLIAWFPAMALLRRSHTYQVLSLVVLIYYGSALWGLLPADPRVSYDGHLSGLLAGILAALLLRGHIPQDPKPEHDTQVESEEDEYMRFDYRNQGQPTPDDNSE